MSICDGCIHDYVCGLEDNHEEGIVSCADRIPKMGHCKDCRYFQYDYVINVDGIPLILAHEFCKRWGDGCKTNEDGYCFLYEAREGDKE